MYQALYRKWRPRTFDDVVGQEHITDILRTQVSASRLSHAYLFTGTRGTGKTTCAKILSKAANCLHPVNGSPCNVCDACKGIDNGSIMDVVEIDAASNNGVDNVRALRDEAVFTPANVRMRVYIIDEVHMLSGSAFNALLKILEEPPEHLMFILATTEVHKVPATVASRCQRFAFRRLGQDVIRQRLLKVAAAENIDLEDEAAILLSAMADGAMRDALSLLDQCASAGGRVDTERVYNCTGMAGTLASRKLLFAAARGNAQEALALFDEIYSGGTDVTALLDELSTVCRNMLIYKAVSPGPLPGAYALSSEEMQEADTLGARRLMDVLSALRDCQARAKVSTDRRIDAQLCLMNIAYGKVGDDDLLSRVQRLEERLAGSPPAPPAPSRPAVSVPKREEPARPPEPWKAAPPVTVSDVPPWEDPPAADSPVPEPPKAPEKAPTKEAPQYPEPRTTSPSPAVDGSFDWLSCLERAKDRLEASDYASFSLSGMVAPTLVGDTLYLTADNIFLAARLSDAKTLNILKECAGVKAVKVNEEPPAEDNFSKLLSLEGKFDNIKFE